MYKIARCAGRTEGDDLDALPLPAYDLVDVNAFHGFMSRVARAAHKQEIFDCTPPVMAIKYWPNSYKSTLPTLLT